MLSAYPENALELFKTLDYWECKELLDISSSNRIEPTDKLQKIENDNLNDLLDKKAYNRIEWMYMKTKKSLYNIYKISKNLIN